MKPITGWAIIGSRKKNLTEKEFFQLVECGMITDTKKQAEEDIERYKLPGYVEKAVKFTITFTKRK